MKILKNKKILIIVAFLAVAALALFFRFWQLNSVPPGLYPDVAINGNDALDTIQSKNLKLFYPENNGREGLFMWLIALSFLVFGPSVWAIKFVAASFGFLTVIGLYFLTKELFKIINNKNAEIIALLSSFFLAVSFWHTLFSRIGFRAIMVPFFLVFGFYFLFKGFNGKKLYNFIISGVFFGLGFYTYISYRFVVFILTTSLISWWLVYKKPAFAPTSAEATVGKEASAGRQNLQKQFLKFTVYGLLSTFIVALPIGIYFLNHPQDFFGRATGVSVFSQPNPILLIGKSLLIHLGMFNFYGDANWRHNFSGSPQLLWVVGIFFIIGIILSLKDLIVSFKNRNNVQTAVHGLFLSWFFFMLLPGILSYEGIPHSLRVVGTIPVVYIFSGFGAFCFFEKIKRFYKTKKQAIAFAFIIAVFLAAIAYSEFNKYFYQWGKRAEVKNAYSENYLNIGNYLNSLPDDVQKYVVVNQDGVPVPWPDGIPMPAQTPMFIERAKFGQPRATYILPKDLDNIKIEKDTIFVFLGYDHDLLFHTNWLFPDGRLDDKDDVWTFTVTSLKSCKCGQ